MYTALALIKIDWQSYLTIKACSPGIKMSSNLYLSFHIMKSVPIIIFSKSGYIRDVLIFDIFICKSIALQ